MELKIGDMLIVRARQSASHDQPEAPAIVTRIVIPGDPRNVTVLGEERPKVCVTAFPEGASPIPVSNVQVYTTQQEAMKKQPDFCAWMKE